MSSSLVHFKFAVDSVAISFDVDTRRNVRKPIHDIVYTSNLGDRSATSAYVGSRPITPSLNILFKDRSNSIGENNLRATSAPRFFSGSSVETSYTSFLLTDTFVRSPDGTTLLPLFYRHLLTTDVVALDSVKVFDSTGQEVSQTYWKVEVLPDGKSYLMNSLESSYDPGTADYNVYWVQYGTVSGASTIGTKKVLVSNKPAYNLATFDDINPLTSSLYTYAKAYILTLLGTGGYLVNTPDSSKQYAIRDAYGTRIELKLPVAVDDEDFWFASVTNSSWTKSYRTNNDPEVFTYDVPEYYNQDFNPYAPYKQDVDRKAFWVAKRLVKLPRRHIYENADEFTLDLVVWDKEEEVVKYALTTDATKVGTVFTDADGEAHSSSLVEDNILWTDSEILSIDRLGGFINLSVDLRSDYVLRGTYYYEEEQLELTQINLNPVLNPVVQNKKIVFYLVPKSEDPNNNLLRTSSIHYLIVNEFGTIDSCSQDGVDGNEDLATSLTNGYWFYERTASATTSVTIAPAHTTVTVTSTADWPEKGVIRVKNGAQELSMTYEGKTSTVLTLTAAASTFGLGTTITAPVTVRLGSFVDNWTVDSTWPFTPGMGSSGAGDTGHWYRYLILGEISVVANMSISDLSLIDTRLEGGIIRDSVYEDARALNPEVAWRREEYEEFGQYYPGRGAIVVKLPYGLLDTYGGSLTEDQIRAIVSRHVAGGMYVIVRFE